MKQIIIFALTIVTVNAVNLTNVLDDEVESIESNSFVGDEELARITEGQNAAARQFPYHVGISFKRKGKKGRRFGCGASIIDHEWILTAAHCTDDMVRAKVILGATNINHREIKHIITPDNVTRHPDYDAKHIINDIALIKIPFTNYTRRIKPVNLPSDDSSSYVGEKAVVTGWGRIADRGRKESNILQWATLEVIDNAQCGKAFRRKVRSTNLCIATANGVSTCKGDSGGPLVLPTGNVQIGISSFSAQSCQLGYPAGFTRVTSYLKWIKDTTGIST